MNISVKYMINSLAKYFLIFFLLLSTYSSILTIFNGSENSSMLRVFSDDEVSQVDRLQEMIKDESLDSGGFIGGFYHYGQAYNTLTYALINTLEFVGFDKFDYQISVLILKLISLTGYVVSVALVYLILRSLGVSESISSIFSLIFGIHTDYWGWATTIHPDTLQMCLMLISFYFILKIKSINTAILISSFFIGLSFGAKYSGIFLAIFIASLISINTIYRIVNNKIDNVNYFINISSWSILSFFTGWVVLNPYILFRFNKLLEDLSFQNENLTNLGGGRVLDNRWIEWVFMYQDEYELIVVFIITGLLCLFIHTLNFLFKNKANVWRSSLFSDRRSIAIVSITFYLFIGSLYLFIVIKYREWRYSYHLLPFIIIISAYGFHLLMKWINRDYIIAGIFFLALFLLIPKGLSNFQLLANTHYSESKNPYVTAGKWLKNKYNSNNIILAGTYSYVDDKYFNNIAYTYDLNRLAIQTYTPDVIFMNDSVPGRYVWKKKGTLISDNEFIYKEKWKNRAMVDEYGVFLQEITSKESSWKVVYETESVVIFERK
jgi:hypothetical protein